MRASIVLILAATAAIGLAQPKPAGRAWDDPNTVAHRTLSGGVVGTDAEEGRVRVLRTEASLADYRKSLGLADYKFKIDWDKEQVLAVETIGNEKNGMGIRIERLVRRAPGQISAEAVLQKDIPLLRNRNDDLNFVGARKLSYALIVMPRVDAEFTLRILGE